MKKRLCVFSLLGFLFFEKHVFAIIPMDAFKETSTRVPHSLLSPQIGVIAINSGFISNLRFINFPPSSDKNQKEKTPLDPIASMLDVYFPSRDQTLKSYFNADTNFTACIMKFFPDPKSQSNYLAHLMAYTDSVRFEAKEPLDSINKNLTEMLKGPNGKNLRQFTKILQDSISMEILREKHNASLRKAMRASEEPLSIHATGTPELLLSSFIYYQFDDPKFLDDYLTDIVGLIKVHSSDDMEQKEVMNHIYEKMVAMYQATFQVMPYVSCTFTPSGKTFPYNRETKKGSFDVSDAAFTDCGENTTRHILNLLLYDPATKGFSFPPDLKDTPYLSEIKTFYAPSKAVDEVNHGNNDLRYKWNQVVGDMRKSPKDSYLGPIRYKKGDETKGFYEVHSGFINLINVFHHIFAFPLPPQELLASGNYNEWIIKAFTSLCKTINPRHEYQINTHDIIYEKASHSDLHNPDTHDIFGSITITFVRDGTPTLQFDITSVSMPGHINVSRLKNLIKNPVPDGLGDYFLKLTKHTTQQVFWFPFLHSDEYMGQFFDSDLLTSYKLLGMGDLRTENNAQRDFLGLLTGLPLEEAGNYSELLKNLLLAYQWNDTVARPLISKDVSKLWREYKEFRPAISEAVQDFGFSDDSLSALYSFKNLHYLTLKTHKTLDELDLGSFQALKEAKLVASTKKITVSTENKALQVLEVERIGEINFLERLPNLQKLKLKETTLSRIELQANPNLKELYIHTAPVTEIEGLEQLRMLKSFTAISLPDLSTIKFSLANQDLHTVILLNLGVIKKVSGIQDITNLQEIQVKTCPKLSKETFKTNLHTKVEWED